MTMRFLQVWSKFLVDAPGDFDQVCEVIGLRVKSGDVNDNADESAWAEIPFEEGSRYVILDLTGDNSQFFGNTTFSPRRNRSAQIGARWTIM
jgi:hypothetical protein